MNIFLIIGLGLAGIRILVLCYTVWRIYNDKNIDNDYNDWINEQRN